MVPDNAARNLPAACQVDPIGDRDNSCGIRMVSDASEKESTMVHHVKDLSRNQRVAIEIENLFGRALSDEESLTIRPARILKDAPVRLAGIGTISICWLIASKTSRKTKSTPRLTRRCALFGTPSNDRHVRLITVEYTIMNTWKRDSHGTGCLTILGVPAEIGHSEDCVPLPYGRGSECWY